MQKLLLFSVVLSFSSRAVADTATTPAVQKPVLKKPLAKPLVLNRVEFSGVNDTELTAAGKMIKVAKGEVVAKAPDDGKPVEYVIEWPVKPNTLHVGTPIGLVTLDFVAGKTGPELKVTPAFGYAVTITNAGKVDKKLDKQPAGLSCDPHPWLPAGAKGDTAKLSIKFDRAGTGGIWINGDHAWTWYVARAGAANTAPADAAKIIDSAAPANKAKIIDSAAPAGKAKIVDNTAPAGKAKIVDNTAPAGTAKIMDSTAPAGTAKIMDSTAPAGTAKILDSSIFRFKAETAFGIAIP